jgi:hypothetical protein
MTVGTERGIVPDSEPDQFEARLKALEDAEDNTFRGRTAASRGGFRQERDDLLREAEGSGARLG